MPSQFPISSPYFFERNKGVVCGSFYYGRTFIELLLGSMGVGIVFSRIVGVHYGLYVAIELLLRFVSHGNVFMGLQSNE
jgi:hypothetical protein